MPVVELSIDSTGAITGLKQYDKAVDDAGKKTDTAFSKMRGAVTSIGTAVGVTLVAGFAAASAAAVSFASALSQAGASAREIENLSRLAGQSVEDFQNAAFATEKFGVSAEHLADISKDVSDKLGDFIATGAGPFADFFENVAPKVGLTAEALAKMSGPDALVAVKKAMDDANISAKEQVFYLESIGNDLTLLNPLLADNGKLWKEGADAAAQMGTALSQMQIDRLKEGQEAVGLVTSGLVSLKDKILSEIAPVFAAFVGAITQGMSDANITIDDMATKLGGDLLTGVTKTTEVVRALHNGLMGIHLAALGLIVAFGEVVRAVGAATGFIGKALVAMGKDDPFKEFSKSAEDFANSATEAFDAQLTKISETNDKYDEVDKTVKKIVADQKELNQEVQNQTEPQKEVQQNQEGILQNQESMVNNALKLLQVQGDLSKESEAYKSKLAEATKAIASAMERQDPYLDDIKKHYQEQLTALESNNQKQQEITASVNKKATAEQAVTKAIQNSTKALNDQKTAAGKRGEVDYSNRETRGEVDYSNRETGEAGAYSSGGSGAGGGFSGTMSAHGGALTDEEWQALPQYQKDMLTQDALKGSSSYDYFSRKTGSRFTGEQGHTQASLAQRASFYSRAQENKAANQEKMTQVINNFNSSISRSDVTNIIEESERSMARS